MEKTMPISLDSKFQLIPHTMAKIIIHLDAKKVKTGHKN